MRSSGLLRKCLNPSWAMGISTFEFVLYYSRQYTAKIFSWIWGWGVMWGETLATWRFGQGYRAYIWVSCLSFSLTRFLGNRFIWNHMCTLCFSHSVIPMLWQISRSNSKMLQFPHRYYKTGTMCLVNFLMWLSKNKETPSDCFFHILMLLPLGEYMPGMYIKRCWDFLLKHRPKTIPNYWILLS